MSFVLNSDVLGALEPPIAECETWIAGRTFPTDQKAAGSGAGGAELSSCHRAD